MESIQAPRLIHYELMQLQDSQGDSKDVQDPKVDKKDEEKHALTEEDTVKKAEN